MKIRKKAEKEKKKGGEYSLNYNMMMHPVKMLDDKFIIFAEAFYPEYRTVTNMTYDYYGRMMPQTYTVFDGYKYFNAIAACFDSEGNIIWNQDIDIWDILTFDLDRYVNLQIFNDEVSIFYCWNNQINYKVFDDLNYSQDSDNVNLQKRNKKDKVLDDKNGKITHWYDNYFLCTGYQEIRNNSLAKNKRTVFFLQKVAFQ
jgi:hypothetical protein